MCPSLAVLSEEESNGAEPPSCSLYMKELQTFIARAVDDYLAAFSCKPLITARLVELTAGRGTAGSFTLYRLHMWLHCIARCLRS